MKKFLLLSFIYFFAFQSIYAQNEKWSYVYQSNKSENLDQLRQLEAFNGFNYFIVEFDAIPQKDKQMLLKNSGFELLGYLDNNNYWARIQSNSLTSSYLNNFAIKKIAIPQAELKSNPYLEAITSESENGNFVLKLWSGDDIKPLISALEIEYSVTAAIVSESRGLLEINANTAQLNDILRHPAVAYIGPLSRSAIPLLANSITMNRVNVLQSENFGPGLSGSGVTVGIWDGGISGGHVDLNGHVENIENTFFDINESKHATYVAGIVGAKGHKSVRVKGMAPDANIKLWTFDGDLIQEMKDGIANENLNII
ncbi:MAG: S8 family serine peptidase, partial [Chitinophagales bacterium]